MYLSQPYALPGRLFTLLGTLSTTPLYARTPRMQVAFAPTHRSKCTDTSFQSSVGCTSRSQTRRAARVSVRAAAQTDTKSPPAKVAALKQEIIRLSGRKYGHDLDSATRQQVELKVKELEDLQLPVKVQRDKLTGTNWTTVYTTSTGTSSGKVGPFITDVTQVFPSDEPGVYYNESRLGLVCARLRGEYDVTRDDRVDLEFKNLVLKVGPFQAAEKVFAAGQMRGYWKINYCDDDFRVFTTNMGNLFVLRKL